MKHGREVILASSEASIPQRGEIWLVNFDPTIGTEIRKTRPAVVVSSDAVGRLPIKLVAPLTDWKEHFAPNLWHVRIDPNPANGLTKVSAADALQLRGMDHRRFVRKLGQVSPTRWRKLFWLLRQLSNTHNAVRYLDFRSLMIWQCSKPDLCLSKRQGFD